ncbi:hypothetical protein GII32_10700 [Gordonia amarae]|uniref:hypothetical protein n=1 Tax=Gordonia amarae TaxID=36821 RepID=UPI001AF72C00|nr:hypothetical protein [Gordonia amarae]QHN30786.1 hypothetical protein GII32_10700 [Gordonia amarae]
MSAASAGAKRKGRASMDINGHQSETGTRQGHSKSRRNISVEAQRKTAGDAAVAFYAAQNPAVNIDKTYLNVDRVNDGNGGFRETRSIDEVVAYGDAREERVRKGIKTGERFAVTRIYHLPWSYLEEDGTRYQPRHRDGTPRVDAAGDPVMLPRYRIIPGMEEAATRYFEDCLEFDALTLPDGQRGIHGFSIQFDEHRPHMQTLEDAFYEAPTKKDAAKMESGYSRAFGSHRSDRLVPAATDDGKAIFNADGSPKMVREGNKRKFSRYHREFKTFMVERGHQVELERDELRHDRKLEHEDFKDWANEGLILAAERAAVDEADVALTVAEAELDQYQTVLDDVALSAVVVAERTRTEAELAADQIQREAEADAAMVRERAEVEVEEQAERGYRRGMSKGRSEGRAAGRREAEEIVATAQVEADQIRDNAIADMEVECQRVEAERADRERELSELAETLEAERARVADDRATVDMRVTEAVVALEHAQSVVDGDARPVDEIQAMYERHPLGRREGIEYVASRARGLADRADRIADSTRAADESRKRYEKAIESIEVNKDDLPHLRERVLEETTLPTKSGKRRSLADIADEKAKQRFVEKFGVRPTEKAMATTCGEARANQADVDQKFRASLPGQWDQQGHGHLSGQSQ